jgi:hypothetical protein
MDPDRIKPVSFLDLRIQREVGRIALTPISLSIAVGFFCAFSIDLYCFVEKLETNYLPVIILSMIFSITSYYFYKPKYDEFLFITDQRIRTETEEEK